MYRLERDLSKKKVFSSVLLCLAASHSFRS
jgi:hypothetical protein